jgi:hypothetical protein
VWFVPKLIAEAEVIASTGFSTHSAAEVQVVAEGRHKSQEISPFSQPLRQQQAQWHQSLLRDLWRSSSKFKFLSILVARTVFTHDKSVQFHSLCQ